MSYTRPAKLAYKGVLIERPCVWCDTVNFHSEGLCGSGPCVQCGRPRTDETGRSTHWYADDHQWQGHEYLPADFDVESQAFNEMLEVVRVSGWPESYTSDLFRDYQNLTGKGVYDGKPLEQQRFIWVLRPLGTHMFLADGYGRSGLKYMITNEPNARYYLWGGPRGLMLLQNGDTAATVLALPPVTFGPPIGARS